MAARLKIPTVWTVAEAARLLRIAPRTLNGHILTGRLRAKMRVTYTHPVPGVTFRYRRYVITTKALEDYLEDGETRRPAARCPACAANTHAARSGAATQRWQRWRAERLPFGSWDA